MLKRTMIFCMCISLNLFSMDESFFQRMYNNLTEQSYNLATAILGFDNKNKLLKSDSSDLSIKIISKKQEPSYVSSSSQDYQNVLAAIFFLENTKTIQRKLKQSDIADEPISKNKAAFKPKLEKLLHQKAYKRPLVKVPSHRCHR